MDSLTIESKMLRAAVSKLVEKTIINKLGCDTDIDLKKLVVDSTDDVVHIDLACGVSINKADIVNLICM